MAEPSGSDSEALATIATGAIVSMAALAAAKAINYVFRLLVARMGVGEYGLFTIGMTFFEAAVMLAGFAFWPGVIKYVVEYRQARNKAGVERMLFSALVMTFAAGVILAALANTTEFYRLTGIGDSVAAVLALLALGIPFAAAYSIVLYFMRAFKNVVLEMTFRNVFENALRLAFALAAIYLGYGILGVCAGIVLASAVSFFASFYAAKRFVAPLGFWTWARKGMPEFPKFGKTLLHFSTPLMAGTLLATGMKVVDVTLLGLGWGVHEVGIYGIAMLVAATLTLLPATLVTLFLPTIVEKLNSNRRADVDLYYKTVNKWIMMVNLPVFLLMTVFPGQLLTLLFGKQYAAGAAVLSVMSFGYLLTGFQGAGNDLLTATGRTKRYFAIYAISSAFGVLLYLALIPPLGAVGAAFAGAAMSAFYTLLLTVSILQSLKIHFLSRGLVKSVFAGLGAVSVLYVLAAAFDLGSNLALMAGALAAFGIVYLALIVALRCFDSNDLVLEKSISAKTGVRLGPFLRKFLGIR